ncbi:MAG: DNA replication/repair protein RecF, partial [Sediminispirochaetaceae bacterium]
LLYDVLLELDGEKRKSFLKELPEYEQIFFTFLPDERYLELADDDTSMYLVENGCIQKMKNT